MKYAFVGIVVLGVVIYSLLAIFDLEISITPKKPAPQTIAGNLTEKNSEKTVEPAGSAQDIAIISPTLTTKPPADVSTPTTAPSEQLATPAKAPDPDDKLPPQAETATIVTQAAFKPTLPTSNNLTQGLGLLTDTGETEDNGILEPRSTQVHPKLPKKALKKAEGTPVESIVEETGGMHTAILPEGSYPFSILLETFDERANAEKAITIYLKRGITSFWVKVDLGNSGVKYRLFAGTFSSEAAAQAFRARHHLNAQRVKNAPFAACIGVFHDKKTLSTAFVDTAAAGAFPYILGTKGGPFILYVGAFYTADGAENQCRELVDKGLPCKAVPRSTLPPKN
jgi:SPOR domain